MRVPLLCLLGLLATSWGQEIELVEQFDAGRHVVEDVQASLSLSYPLGGGGLQDGERSVHASFETRVHTIFLAVEAGRPRRLLRAWETLESGETTLLPGNLEPPREVDLAADDPRQLLAVELELDAAGAGRLRRGPRDLAPEALHRVLSWRSSRLLPNRTVFVGESWQVGIDRVPPPFAVRESPAEAVEGSLEVRLEGLTESEDGQLRAELVFSGSLTWSYREMRAGREQRQVTTNIELEGSALVDPLRGQLMRLQQSGVVTLRERTVDGRVVHGSGQLEESHQFQTGHWHERAPELVFPEPVGSDSFQASPGPPLKHGELLVLRNPEQASPCIEVVDAESGNFLRRLAVFPLGSEVGALDLSPDRKRLAFASTLNNQVSLAEWNLFVHTLVDGTLQQLTPGWARGAGLAVPQTTTQRGTLKGSVAWRDARGQLRRDVLEGEARLDAWDQSAVIDGSGNFQFRDAPAGVRQLRVRARTQHGWYETQLSCQVQPEALSELPSIDLAQGAPASGFQFPSWSDNTHLTGRSLPGSLVFLASPERSFQQVELPDLSGLAGYAPSPDGRWLGFHAGDQLAFFDAASRQIGARFEAPFAAQVETGQVGSWLLSSKALLLGARRSGSHGDWPVLLAAFPEQRQSLALRSFPEWVLDGGRLLSTSLSADERRVYLVVAMPLDSEGRRFETDAWVWDVPNERLQRLTACGDVLQVLADAP